MSPTMPATGTCPAGPRLPRPSRPPAAVPEGRLPPNPAAAAYTVDTLALLNALTTLERGVVEWRAANHSVAESYRLARGRDSATAKQSGYQILRRPRVAAALGAVLCDRGVDARADRDWALRRLKRIVDEAAEMRTPGFAKTLIDAIDLMCRLQGELPLGRSGRREPRAERPGVKERIAEMLADVARRTTAPKAPPADPNPPDRPVAESTRPRPRPAVVDPPAVAPSATPPPDQAPPAADPPVPSAERTRSRGPVKPAVRIPPPEDGLPIGVLRAFGGEIRIPQSEAAVPPPTDVEQCGPVLPRVSSGPIQYRGASRYFMGTWQ